ncbi:13753_t:CDS:1, partial [Racocetra fulgida]
MASNKSILISFVLFFSIFSPHVLTVPLSPETQKEPDSNALPPSDVTEIKFEDLPSSGELYKLESQLPDETGSEKTTAIGSQPDSNYPSTESSESPTTPQANEPGENAIDPSDPKLNPEDTNSDDSAHSDNPTNNRRSIIQSSDATIVHSPVQISGSVYLLESPIVYKHKKVVAHVVHS